MALWKLLCNLGLHSIVVDLMEGLYTVTCSCVNVDGVMSDWFAVGSGVRQGCKIAVDLFLGPMDHMMEYTVHWGMTRKGGVHWFGLCGWCFFASRNVESTCSCTDSYAGRGIYFWSPDKLVKNQNPTGSPSTSSSTVQVADGHVEVVDAFVYLRCMINSSGGSRGEVLCRIGIAQSCIHEYAGEEDLEVKHQAGNQVTPQSDIHCASFDVWVRDMGHHKVPALSPWCIWHVGTTQDHEVTVYSPCVKCRSQRNHWLFTAFLLVDRCLQLFGHIAHSSSRKDHHLALAVAIWQVPPDWKRPVGRPSYNWLRAIEADLGPLNFDLVTAWRKATTQDNILWTQQRSSGVRYERKTAIANRSRVSCAHSMLRASMITPWPWKYFRIIF